MARSTTPTYRIEFWTNDKTGALTPSCWRGRATEARLAEYVTAQNASFHGDGVNAHVGEMYGADFRVVHARLVHQATGQTIAWYHEAGAPALVPAIVQIIAADREAA